MSDRPLNTPAQRVSWAIEQSGRTLAAIADQIGCTHVTLVLWRDGKTELFNAKVHLVHAFARAVNVNVEWLLVGEGPVRPGYETPLENIVHRIEARSPEMAYTAERLLRALLPEDK